MPRATMAAGKKKGVCGNELNQYIVARRITIVVVCNALPRVAERLCSLGHTTIPPQHLQHHPGTTAG